MIYKKINSTQYRSEFIDKFTSFGEKAPIMISFATDELGVTVVHENSNKTYFYPWDYTIPVKIFIHNIKDELSRNHYPRVSRLETVVHNFTPEEQADMIVNGVSVDSVPVSKTEEKMITYRIDKILAMKDEFILIDENTGDQYRYKMAGSSIYFLKNYRQGEYKTTEEAGDVFFKKSQMIGKLTNINN